jgi:hypothetical protein
MADDRTRHVLLDGDACRQMYMLAFLPQTNVHTAIQPYVKNLLGQRQHRLTAKTPRRSFGLIRNGAASRSADGELLRSSAHHELSAPFRSW